MEYVVCEADSAEKLADAVNQRLAEGWQPTGNLVVVESHHSGKWWYYQALLRIDADDE